MILKDGKRRVAWRRRKYVIQKLSCVSVSNASAFG